jgi:hypothetical protein
MTVKMKLPPGCSGVDSRDGTKYDARGGVVELADHHAAEVNRSKWAGDSGLLSTSESWAFGTKTGRKCGSCNREWNAWNSTCPRCGDATDPV